MEVRTHGVMSCFYFHSFISIWIITTLGFLPSGCLEGGSLNKNIYIYIIYNHLCCWNYRVLPGKGELQRGIYMQCCKMESSYLHRCQFFFKKQQKAALTAWQPWIFPSILRVFESPTGQRTSRIHKGPAQVRKLDSHLLEQQWCIL